MEKLKSVTKLNGANKKAATAPPNIYKLTMMMIH